jgi:uncharacterized membrane protein YhaH (DUF805 family)
VWRPGLAEWTPAFAVPELGPDTPAAAAAGEERSLNPWTVFKRSFQPAGRFSRGEYAIACFAPIAAMIVLVALATIVTIAAGSAPSGGGRITVGPVVVMAFAPVLLLGLASTVTGLVAGIRRCHDLGQSGWLVLLTFVPLVNVVAQLYLLLAPGVQAAGGPSPARGGSWVVPAVAGVVALIVPAGIVAAIAIPSLLRARVSANESAAIADIRSMISAQAAYHTLRGGRRWSHHPGGGRLPAELPDPELTPPAIRRPFLPRNSA